MVSITIFAMVLIVASAMIGFCFCGTQLRVTPKVINIIGYKQVYPIGCQNSWKQTLCQFLSPRTNKIKSRIISSILTESCTHATVTFGVGIGSLYVERVIHFGVPRTMESFFQESRRAGRGGRPAKSTVCFNNDIGANVEGMQPLVREHCKYPKSGCRRKLVSKDFGLGTPGLVISHFGYKMCP